jgi:hypothetical protein
VSAKTNEYKALYRQDGVIHSFIFEMSIDATIVECICLAWEFDLVQSWNKVARFPRRQLSILTRGQSQVWPRVMDDKPEETRRLKPREPDGPTRPRTHPPDQRSHLRTYTRLPAGSSTHAAGAEETQSTSSY